MYYLLYFNCVIIFFKFQVKKNLSKKEKEKTYLFSFVFNSIAYLRFLKKELATGLQYICNVIKMMLHRMAFATLLPMT